jgi:hypothetical protein
VLEAAAVCGRTPTFEIARLRGRELVVSNPLQGIANRVIQVAFIQAAASGVSNVLEVVEEGTQNGMKVSESQVKQILQGLSDAQFLTDEWFWRPCMSSEPFGQVGERIKRESERSGLKLRLSPDGAAAV